MITLISLAVLMFVAITSTIVTVVRDGYRRQPDRTPQRAYLRDELHSAQGSP